MFFSYDPKDPYNTHRVDLAIFSRPADPAANESTDWSQPNPYTGGDVGPWPLAQGLIFTRYSIDTRFQVHSQVWLQSGPGTAGTALTAPPDDCAQPAVSPDGKLIAMVCRHGQLRTADLAVAPLHLASSSIGAPVTFVSGQLVASPSFAWNGMAIAYLAPASPGGPFQLWTIAAPAPGKAGSPIQVTQNLGFDSASAPVWLGS